MNPLHLTLGLLPVVVVVAVVAVVVVVASLFCCNGKPWRALCPVVTCDYAERLEVFLDFTCRQVFGQEIGGILLSPYFLHIDFSRLHLVLHPKVLHPHVSEASHALAVHDADGSTGIRVYLYVHFEAKICRK